MSAAMPACTEVTDTSQAADQDVLTAPARDQSEMREMFEVPISVNEETSEDVKLQRTKLEQSLSHAGISEIETLDAFLNDVRTAAKTNDKEAIAAMVFYPYRVYEGGEVVSVINTSDQFLEQFDIIIPPASLKKLQDLDVSSFWGNWRGGTVNRGFIWFNGYDGAIRIISIARE